MESQQQVFLILNISTVYLATKQGWEKAMISLGVVPKNMPLSQDGSVRPMRMCTTADLMWQSDSAHRPFIKAFAVDEDALRRSTVFVGNKADKIAVVFVYSAHPRGKGRFAGIAAIGQLNFPRLASDQIMFNEAREQEPARL